MGILKVIVIIIAVWFSMGAFLFLFMIAGYLFRERPFSQKRKRNKKLMRAETDDKS